jgi:hypothetical protein
MPTFTAPNGSTVSIPGSAVVRMRDVYPEESTEANAKCRIDHPGVQFVVEDLSAVIPAVKSENVHIGQLTLPNAKPVWFNGTVSRGPIRMVSGHPPAAQSALYITDKIQYVTETPEAVRLPLRPPVARRCRSLRPKASSQLLQASSASSARRPKSGTDGHWRSLGESNPCFSLERAAS